MQHDEQLPIEDHGVIGDLRTVALVGIDGGIDFCCFPRFDSPTVFASLLDSGRGGYFSISPIDGGMRPTQMYLPDTNVLLTRFLADSGVAELLDLMTPGDEPQRLLRQLRVVRGGMRFRVTCAPRFDYARAEHTAVREDERTVLFEPETNEQPPLRLRSSIPLEVSHGDVSVELELEAGQTIQFSLEEAHSEPRGSALEVLDPEVFAGVVNATSGFWRRWVNRIRYQGRWPEMVRRSALTLKMLTSREHGSLVAAPTFGLPEVASGVRNWDYRFTWIRDSAFTMYALMRLGYTEEAKAFIDWIEGRCHDLGDDEPLQPLYGLDGRREIEEIELDNLAGYRGSTPVRIGNGAYTHLQLDLYGALLDTVYLYNKYGEPISYDLWEYTTKLVDWVCENYSREDRSVWEVRGEPRSFTYSRVMCWVAIDRALRLASKHSFPAPVERWTRVRDEVFDQIQRSFWNSELEAFVQAKGSSDLDAGTLIMPLVKFLGPTDPRWLSTMAALERDLVEGALVRRYRSDDGLPGEEGSFTMCSFWYAECLARAGRVDDARLQFEKTLGFANHLGLFSEMIGHRGQHLGNTPQALTHLALISAAWNLNRRLDDRAESV